MAQHQTKRGQDGGNEVGGGWGGGGGGGGGRERCDSWSDLAGGGVGEETDDGEFLGLDLLALAEGQRALR